MNAWVVSSTIIENKEGKILLTQQTPGRFHAGKWGTPGGVLEPEKTIIQQAVDEIKEETNLNVSIEKIVGIYKEKGEPTGKEKEQTVVFVFKRKLRGGKVKIPKDEISDFGWFSVEEIKNWGIKKLRPMMKRIIDDYAKGKTFPLNVIALGR